MTACAGCGRESDGSFAFCPFCGRSRSEPVTRTVRKTVTVLFCDLVDSTGFADGRDAEAVERSLSRYFEAARAVVDRNGGTVAKFIGDAVVAVFGIPAAHEDDPMRAVAAALGIH